jgi:hypothetical protein
MAKALDKAKKKLENRQKVWDNMKGSKDATTRPGSMNRKKRA